MLIIFIVFPHLELSEGLKNWISFPNYQNHLTSLQSSQTKITESFPCCVYMEENSNNLLSNILHHRPILKCCSVKVVKCVVLFVSLKSKAQNISNVHNLPMKIQYHFRTVWSIALYVNYDICHDVYVLTDYVHLFNSVMTGAAVSEVRTVYIMTSNTVESVMTIIIITVIIKAKGMFMSVYFADSSYCFA